MRAAAGMLMAIALVTGSFSVHAQLAEDNKVADEAVQPSVDHAQPLDTYGLSRIGSGGNRIHAFPPKNSNAARNLEAANVGAATPPLTYHGGPIMPSVTIYTIFWIPPTLQDGTATAVSAKYKLVNNSMLGKYPGHGIDNNNTQYNQTAPLLFVGNVGAFGKTFTDTTAYPASGCNEGVTGTNCITDAQMQAEISKVIAAQAWPNGGITNIYFLYTSSGEGSCVDGTNTFCAYVQYCAYHSANGSGAQPIIYAIEPYGDPNYCQNPGQPSPNADVNADTAATSSSHELSESITDPEPNSGWINSDGNEIGDLCAYKYGTNTWDSGKANQNWNGTPFELQQEWDNHRGLCVQVGP